MKKIFHFRCDGSQEIGFSFVFFFARCRLRVESIGVVFSSAGRRWNEQLANAAKTGLTGATNYGPVCLRKKKNWFFLSTSLSLPSLLLLLVFFSKKKKLRDKEKYEEKQRWRCELHFDWMTFCFIPFSFFERFVVCTMACAAYIQVYLPFAIRFLLLFVCFFLPRLDPRMQKVTQFKCIRNKKKTLGKWLDSNQIESMEINAKNANRRLRLFSRFFFSLVTCATR